jgi:hypothetical protein
VDQEEFGWLVARLETESANAPRAFRTKVFLMSLVAYAALLLALLVNLLILYWAFTHVRDHGIKLSLIGVGLMGVMSIPIFYVTLRTLLMRLPAPKGSAMTGDQAPILFDVLDKMRVKLNGPPIHHVLVDKDYNACIMQLPRWGLVGPSVNYLVVGLPFIPPHPTSSSLPAIGNQGSWTDTGIVKPQSKWNCRCPTRSTSTNHATATGCRTTLSTPSSARARSAGSRHAVQLAHATSRPTAFSTVSTTIRPSSGFPALATRTRSVTLRRPANSHGTSSRSRWPRP